MFMNDHILLNFIIFLFSFDLISIYSLKYATTAWSDSSFLFINFNQREFPKKAVDGNGKKVPENSRQI